MILGVAPLIAIAVIAGLSGQIEFTYPRLAQNKVLRSPLLVVSINKSGFTLEDGRSVRLLQRDIEPTAKLISDSNQLVDLVITETGAEVAVFVSRRQSFTPEPPQRALIRIPLFAQDVNANHRVRIGLGVIRDPRSANPDPFLEGNHLLQPLR